MVVGMIFYALNMFPQTSRGINARKEGTMKKVTTIKAVAGFNENGQRLKKPKVCAYCRVSSDHIGQQLSFEAQTGHFKSYITQNPEWDFAGVYADEGISGKSKENRTEFLRMLQDAERGLIDLIITKSISRFARNTSDCIETVRYLKSLGVGVFFEKENINTLSAESELILTILSSIAEEELMSLSQNIRWANQKRFKQGKVQLVTERFMGYDRGENGSLVVNEEQAAIVKRIFNDYVSGMGVTKIARALEADGIKNISGGTNWSPTVIRGMLKNEKYIGDAILQKTVTANNITFKRKPNEGEAPKYYVKDNHPAIIEREQFEIVQMLMDDRCRSKGNTPDMRWKFKNRYPLTQMIICGNCGAGYRHVIHNTKAVSQQYFWACSTYIQRKIDTCDMRPIKDETIKQLFIRLFNKLFTNKKILFSYADTLKMMGEAKADGKRIKEIDAEIEALMKQEHVIFAVQEKGYADKSMLILEHNNLINKMGLLREEKIRLIEQLNSEDLRFKRTQDLISFLSGFEKPLEEFDENLFKKIIERIVVKERECLVFHLVNGLQLEERYTLKRGTDIV